jgi:hypothetical protein
VEWAIVIVLGLILGSMIGWAVAIHGMLVDIRSELRRVNEIRDAGTGRHH